MNHELELQIIHATKALTWDEARPFIQSAILAMNDAIFRILNILSEDLSETRGGTRRPKTEGPAHEEDSVARVVQQFTSLMHSNWNGFSIEEPKVNQVQRAVKDVTNLLNATLERNQPGMLSKENGVDLIGCHNDNKPKGQSLASEAADKPGWNHSTRVARGRPALRQQHTSNSPLKTSERSRSQSASTRSTQNTYGTSPGYAKRFDTRTSGETGALAGQPSRKLLSAYDLQRQKEELQRRIRGLGPAPVDTPVRASPMRPGVHGRHSSPSPARMTSAPASRSQSPALTSPRPQQYDLHGRRVRGAPSLATHRRWESNSVEETHGRRTEPIPPQYNAGRPPPAGRLTMEAQGKLWEPERKPVALANSADSPSVHRPQRVAPVKPQDEPVVLQVQLAGDGGDGSGLVVQSADPTCVASGSSVETLDHSNPAALSLASTLLHTDPTHGDVSGCSDEVRKVLFTSLEEVDPPKRLPPNWRESLQDGCGTVGKAGHLSAFIHLGEKPVDAGSLTAQAGLTAQPHRVAPALASTTVHSLGDTQAEGLSPISVAGLEHRPCIPSQSPAGVPDGGNQVAPSSATDSVLPVVASTPASRPLEHTTSSAGQFPRAPDRVLSAPTDAPIDCAPSHPVVPSPSPPERRPLDLHAAPFFVRPGLGAGPPPYPGPPAEERSPAAPPSPPQLPQRSPAWDRQALAWKEAGAGGVPSPQRPSAGRQDPYRIGFTSPEAAGVDVKYVSDVMAEISRSLEHSRQSLAQLPRAPAAAAAAAASPNSGFLQRSPSAAASARSPTSVLTAIAADFEEFAIVGEPERAPQCGTEELPKHSPGPLHASLEPPRRRPAAPLPDPRTPPPPAASPPPPGRPSHQLAIATVQAVLSAQQPGAPAGDWLEITLPDPSAPP